MLTVLIIVTKFTYSCHAQRVLCHTVHNVHCAFLHFSSKSMLFFLFGLTQLSHNLVLSLLHPCGDELNSGPNNTLTEIAWDAAHHSLAFIKSWRGTSVGPLYALADIKPLALQCYFNRLKFIYLLIYGKFHLNMSNKNRSITFQHTSTFAVLFSQISTFKFLFFFPQTILDWNTLPFQTINGLLSPPSILAG